MFGTHKTEFYSLGGMIAVKYHLTNVVRFNDKKIILDSGGWWTSTTKTRMNQASNAYELGYRVCANNFNWYVEYKGERIAFTDGMVLERAGKPQRITESEVT